jgi:hypothetical protein
MTTKGILSSPKKIAGIAGFLYLAHFVSFFLADNGVHSTAVGTIDFAATAHNIVSSERLFRIGFLSYLLTAVFFSWRPGLYTCY